MGRRIAVFLAAYAAFILLLAELGQTLLDNLWGGVVAVGERLAIVAADLAEAALAAAAAGRIEPFFSVVLLLAAVGLATFAWYVLWPLIVGSKASQSASVGEPQAPSGDVVGLPSRERPERATDQQLAA